MKSKILSLTLVAGSLISTSVFSQKSVETSAALEFRQYGEAMMKGDFELAKKKLTKAKESIDIASAHADTKESSKTLYYKGEIYYNFISVGMMTADTNFMKLAGEDAMEVSISSFKKGYAVNDKFDGEIKDAVFNKKMELEKFTGMLYTANKFDEALEIYSVQVKLSDAINMVDSLSIFNTGICAEKAGKNSLAAESYVKCAEIGYKVPEIYSMASNALRKDKKTQEAKDLIAKGRKLYPSDKGMLLELVNTSIDEGNSEEAEKNLQEAIAADPKNKQLYYVIGTIYIDLKQNDKAEAALNKAIELDPNYADAQYQLGAHLVGVASNIKVEASRLKIGDKNYDVLMAQSDEYYKKSLIPLEAYILKNPNDKEVLTILFQINKSLKNTDKALEYKKRADAIK
ncbi:MAG: tetratricopeptide repeat protein [Bacteroidota bacterium]